MRGVPRRRHPRSRGTAIVHLGMMLPVHLLSRHSTIWSAGPFQSSGVDVPTHDRYLPPYRVISGIPALDVKTQIGRKRVSLLAPLVLYGKQREGELVDTTVSTHAL